MGVGEKSRLTASTRMKNRNLFQKLPPKGRCGSARCRALAVQAERYRSLNEELVKENAALKAAEKSNREYSVMFDRFLLKMGQSIPFVQGMRQHLEFAYDNLARIETMVDCFTDAGSLRKFLIGDESFMFEPVPSDEKDAPRSPLVKEAPQREHRRFDDNGDIDTIVEHNSEDEENTTMNRMQIEKSAGLKPAQCLETTTVIQRRSSRRSSIGIPRTVSTSDRPQNKSLLEAFANQTGMNSSTRSSGGNSRSSVGDSCEKQSEQSLRRSSARFPKVSPTRRSTYCKMPPPPEIFVSGADESVAAAPSVRIVMNDNDDVEDDNNDVEDDNDDVEDDNDDGDDEAHETHEPPTIAGKSDEELFRCFETTLVEPKVPRIELAQIHERSPTAINVAQVWAAANALRPAERSPTCTNVAAVLRGASERSADASPVSFADSTVRLSPLGTTQFPSPVVCDKLSALPTSTPAAHQHQNQPCTPEVSMILAEAPSLPTPDPDVAVVGKHVDCRRRKRVFESPKTGNVRTAETFVAMRRSVRFSTASDDPELREPSVAKPVATTSSPFVKNSNVRRNTRMRPSKLVVGGEPGHSDEENVTLKSAACSEHAETSSQPVPRRTFVKKKVATKSIGRKRSERQLSKLESPDESEPPAETGNDATYTVDVLGMPTPKRVRVAFESGKDGTQRPGSSPRSCSSTYEDSSTDSRRRSRRAGTLSYTEPSLRTKLRRDR